MFTGSPDPTLEFQGLLACIGLAVLPAFGERLYSQHLLLPTAKLSKDNTQHGAPTFENSETLHGPPYTGFTLVFIVCN